MHSDKKMTKRPGISTLGDVVRILANVYYRRSFVAVALALGLSLAGATSASPAFAASASISGVVEDTSSTPQANVAVNVIDPATASTITSTTTADDGSFSVAVNPGTYNVQFIPSATSGLQSFLATGVSSDSAPLTVILKTATVVQVQGMLADSQGNVYPQAQEGSITFSSPLNPGSPVQTDKSAGYSISLFADQNFTASASMFTPNFGTQLDFTGLPVGPLDHSQTYNLTVPTALLTVSVRDANGNPITGGKLTFQFSDISPLPGLPGTFGSDQPSSGSPLDSNGNTALPVPDGITLTKPEIVLNNGLTIPFTVPPMNGDKSVTVTVPPSIQVQGMLADSQGNVYPQAQEGSITFSSPLNPGSPVQTDKSAGYSISLFADQNFTASASMFTPNFGTQLDFTGLPVGPLDHSQTYNLTVPTALLTVSVRDANGNPITGGKLTFQFSDISPLPGLPGTFGSDQPSSGSPLDSNGNTALPVPDGITLTKPEIVLNNGLTIPFTVPPMNGDKSVTVTVPPSIQVQGMLADSQGNVYPQAQEGSITFSSPLNPGSPVQTDKSAGYSISLFADQNFTASASMFTPNFGTQLDFTGLPVGPLDHSQTYNLTVPTALLTVSVRDANGNPITGGKLTFQFSDISPLPGLPGTFGSDQPSSGSPLDSNGNTALPVPDGITLTKPEIVLNNGLTIPFTLHPITGDRHAFIIFNETTGTVIVDDQPPNVTGSPDRAPNANGWYNAPVTITWTSVDPAPSSGTPTTPAPTVVSAEGTNQTVTSGKSCDPAGNCSTGTVTGISLDTTPPSVSLTGVTDGATYTGGIAPTPACTTSDPLSGVAAKATLSVTSSGNSYTATCSGAADNAGNSTPAVQARYQVLPAGWTTASLDDSAGNPIAGASAAFRSATSSITATTGPDGIAGVALTPGTYSVTMNYATGYQTKTITVTAGGPNSVSFATVAATVQISDPDNTDLATATAAHAGNTGTFGPKTAVDPNGDVTFQVLPGTSTFTAYDASGYQSQTLTITGPTTVTFATVPATVQISDPDSTDLATASASHAGNTGTFGPKTAADPNGDVTFQVLPGTSTFTAYDANGHQTQTLTITGPTTVTFATEAVTITVLKGGSPLATALVSHAGNTGTFGPKTPVDSNGQITFHVLPGTSTFTAWDGTSSQQQTTTITAPTSTTITVP